jgi:hypothetical protein
VKAKVWASAAKLGMSRAYSSLPAFEQPTTEDQRRQSDHTALWRRFLFVVKNPPAGI